MSTAPAPPPPDLLPQLRAFDLFAEVDDDALRWLIDRSDYGTCREGERIFTQGDPADHMFVLLSGGFIIRHERDGRQRELGLWEAPGVSGVLPFSRMTEISSSGYCTTPTHFLRLHRNHFTEMVNQSYELTQALVQVMTNRVRDFQQMRLMDEKLLALGKMSAGLAHELNNPASAMVRGSRELHKHLAHTPERFKDVMSIRVDEATVDRVNEVLTDRVATGVSCATDLSLLDREARLDELIDWFDDHNIPEGDEVADTFVDWDFGTEHLDRIASALPAEHLRPVLWWVETNLTTEHLVREIQTASGRIAELVRSIKTYSHMDQEPSMEFTDLNEGIHTTITMLHHRTKRNGAEIVQELDENLPHVKVLPGEMNQVWTNLLANAFDALADRAGGRITVRSFQERDRVCVEVEDDGPGIPTDIQSRVFEPFYTTKGIGEGTGMGLDIVRRVVDHHGGSVKLDSAPGRTVFRVCFPT